MSSKQQITGKISQEEHSNLLVLRNELGLDNWGDLLVYLHKHYRTTKGQKPTPAPKPSRAGGSGSESSDSLFVAKIDPRGKQVVEQLRQDLFEEYGHGDAQILFYLAKQHKELKDMKKVLVPLPKKVKELLITNAQDEVDSGQVKSFGDWIAKFLFKKLRGGFF